MWIEASDSQFVNIHDIVFRDYFQEKTVTALKVRKLIILNLWINVIYLIMVFTFRNSIGSQSRDMFLDVALSLRIDFFESENYSRGEKYRRAILKCMYPLKIRYFF